MNAGEEPNTEKNAGLTHDGDTSLEREQIGAIVRSTFREEADASAFRKTRVHRTVHASLVDT